jgi:pectinesterase
MKAALSLLLALSCARCAVADVNIMVRSDGSGDFRSVQAALDFLQPAVNTSLGHVVLHIAGTFFERVHVYSNFTGGVTIIGDAPLADDNWIVYNVSGSSPNTGTFNSWSVKVDAANVTFANVALANNASGYNHEVAGQSVALHIAGDRFACFGCKLWGGQDTLFTGDAPLRSYFSNTYVNGSCDSIFGGSSSVFDDCSIDMDFTVTAHRGDGSTAYLFLGGTVESGQGTLLGRPWGENATVVFKQTDMGRGVEGPGWDDWSHGCTNHSSSWCNTVTFAEFNSTGPGADPSKRVWWSQQLTAEEAALWNTTRLLKDWQPVQP